MSSQASTDTDGHRDEPPVVVKAVSRSHLDELQAEARYHRERLELYRAKAYGPRPTSDTRLRELERMDRGAASRLRRAQQPPTPAD
ncbi:MAG: hypothetical protein H0X28_04910 [Solirubrobacterales bacterium]|nr:hypothetical protein [Solirubrobacterales bacterium]